MEKGSQFLLRKLINNHQNYLNEQLLSQSTSLLSFLDENLNIDWKSPLEEELYKEYRNEFLLLRDEWYSSKNALDEKWAKIGPQWDGLAVLKGKEGYGLLLVEAKAHINEMNSTIRAGEESKNRIVSMLEKVKHYYGSSSNLSIWTEQYYQLSNRLAYIYLLNEKLGIPAWLVLVNFEEDPTHIPTSKSQWIQHYQSVLTKMDINHQQPGLNRVINLTIPAKNIMKEQFYEEKYQL